MANINFVPDDYVQSTESSRANLMCLVLLALVMAALVGSFATIKVRQHASQAKEELITARMLRIKESIRQFEQLQARRKAMMKTALTTAELLESVPRSVLLASLTNNLPPGVSLLKLNFIQKEPRRTSTRSPTSKYKAAKTGKTPQAKAAKLSREKSLETLIDIEGMAPSDLQVAAYIQRLSTSIVLDNIALVESREHTIDDTTFRQFKLTAKLKSKIHLTSDDVEVIRGGTEDSIHNF